MLIFFFSQVQELYFEKHSWLARPGHPVLASVTLFLFPGVLMMGISTSWPPLVILRWRSLNGRRGSKQPSFLSFPFFLPQIFGGGGLCA